MATAEEKRKRQAAAKRKQDERDNWRSRGFVLLQEWVHEQDLERERARLRRLREQRDT